MIRRGEEFGLRGALVCGDHWKAASAEGYRRCNKSKETMLYSAFDFHPVLDMESTAP